MAIVRRKVVLARGVIPADVMFIGEAPGEAEDLRGFPFIGPAGRELDDLIATTMAKTGTFSFVIINVVGCAPNIAEAPGEFFTRAPEPDEARACRPRVVEFTDIAEPKLIVTLGAPAKKYFGEGLDGPNNPRTVSLIHPAAILRQGPGQAHLSRKRWVNSLVRFIPKKSPSRRKKR